MKILFICSRNRRRSPTAEAVFSTYRGIEAASAGTSPDANHVVSADLIEWADLILAMENIHRRKLQERFGPLLRTKKIVVLGVSDAYDSMDPRLIGILKEKVTPYIKS